MAEENANPIVAAKPPVSNPIATGTTAHAATLKLKPVIRKPTLNGAGAVSPLAKPAVPKPAAPAAPAPAPVADLKPVNAIDQLKGMTQKLKGITQEIPATAILHKTGIIADSTLTEAQKQAAKSRTARISLSDAIGVSPVKNEATPMKTIRIKRPTDIKTESSPAPAAPAATPAAAPKPAAAPAAPAAATPAEVPSASLTQRKTLKVARPGAGGPKKFGIKKPAAEPKPADTNAATEVADIPDIADIPDMPADTATKGAAPAAAGTLPSNKIPAVGGFLGVLGLITQIAACGLVAFLGYRFFTEGKMPLRSGGCLPDEYQMSTTIWSSMVVPVEVAEEPIQE